MGEQLTGQAGAGLAAGAQPVDLVAVHDDLLEDVQAVHRDRHTGGQQDRRRLGVVPDVELRDRRGVPGRHGPAHEHDPLDVAGHLGVAAQQQGDVRERCGRDQGHRARGGQDLPVQEGDGVDGHRGPGGRGQAQVAHAVGAVHRGRAGRLQQRALGAPGHRDVGGARLLQHGEGVADHPVHVGVPGHAGHRPEVESRVAYGEQQGQGVVDAGVAVDDHGSGLTVHGGLLPSCRP